MLAGVESQKSKVYKFESQKLKVEKLVTEPEAQRCNYGGDYSDDLRGHFGVNVAGNFGGDHCCLQLPVNKR